MREVSIKFRVKVTGLATKSGVRYVVFLTQREAESFTDQVNKYRGLGFDAEWDVSVSKSATLLPKALPWLAKVVMKKRLQLEIEAADASHEPLAIADYATAA